MTMVRQQYDVSLRGISMRSLSSLIRVTGVTEEGPRIETEAEPYPASDGRILLGTYRRELSVRVRFVLTERFDLEARAAAIDAVNAWALPGRLELSYRPGKILTINVVSERPTVENIKQYTGEYEIKFTATAFPYWTTSVAQGPGQTNTTSTTLSITPAGNLTTFLEANITPKSGTLTNFYLEANGYHIEVTGISVATNKLIRLHFDNNHYQLLHYGTTDLRPYIARTSNDNILLNPGVANSVYFEANIGCDISVVASGVFA